MPDDMQQKPPRKSDGDGGPPKPPVRMSRGAFSWIIIFGLALMLLFMLRQGNQKNQILTTAFWKHVENGEVKKVVIKDDDVITGEFHRAPPNAPNNSTEFQCTYGNAWTDYDEIYRRVHERFTMSRVLVIRSYLSW